MARKRKQKPATQSTVTYTGILAKPREVAPPTLFKILLPSLQQSPVEVNLLDGFEGWLNLFEELCRFHHISPSGPNAISTLCFALMQAHVPAFRTIFKGEGSRGRSKFWSDTVKLRLVWDVDDLLADGKRTEIDACRKLATKDPFYQTASSNGKITPESLQRRLQEARNTPAVAAIIRLCEHATGEKSLALGLRKTSR